MVPSVGKSLSGPPAGASVPLHWQGVPWWETLPIDWNTVAKDPQLWLDKVKRREWSPGQMNAVLVARGNGIILAGPPGNASGGIEPCPRGYQPDYRFPLDGWMCVPMSSAGETPRYAETSRVLGYALRARDVAAGKFPGVGGVGLHPDGSANVSKVQVAGQTYVQWKPVAMDFKLEDVAAGRTPAHIAAPFLELLKKGYRYGESYFVPNGKADPANPPEIWDPATAKPLPTTVYTPPSTTPAPNPPTPGEPGGNVNVVVDTFPPYNPPKPAPPMPAPVTPALPPPPAAGSSAPLTPAPVPVTSLVPTDLGGLTSPGDASSSSGSSSSGMQTFGLLVAAAVALWVVFGDSR